MTAPDRMSGNVWKVFMNTASSCWVQIYTWHDTESSLLNCKPVQTILITVSGKKTNRGPVAQCP